MLQRRFGLLVVVLFLFGSLVTALPAVADSNVRIVRLSYIDGDAQVDPSNQDDGFIHAVQNMPVTAGMWVYTPNSGRAEVEFENGSTVRLVNDAQILFERLSLSDSGGKIDVINVDHGVLYCNFDKVKSEDRITIHAGTNTFHVSKSTHLRMTADQKYVTVAVFRGEATYDGASPVAIKSGETLSFEVAKPTKHTLAKGIDKIDADSWDKDRDEQLSVVASKGKSSAHSDNYSAQYSYLSSYGSYYNVAGYGSVWQPFGMAPGWDPYGNGMWGLYPGMGYMWISSYPWGWAPYRYGQWESIPGYGWVWAPGSNFTTFNVGPRFGAVPIGYNTPVQPVVAAGVKPAQLVVVGNPPNVHPAILAGHAVVGSHTLAAGATVHAAVPHPIGTRAAAVSHPVQHASAGPSTHSGGAQPSHSAGSMSSSGHFGGGGVGHPK